MTPKEIIEALAKPFDPRDVEIKVQTLSRDRSRGLIVSYVDARAVIERLNSVLEGRWSDSYEIIHIEEIVPANNKPPSKEYHVMCKLDCSNTPLAIVHSDVGTSDSLKGAFSDALKRAAVKLGVASYLYSLPKVWADVDEYGNIIDPDRVKAELLGLEAPPDRPARPVSAGSGSQRNWSGSKASGGGRSNKATENQLNAIARMASSLAKREGEKADDAFIENIIAVATGEDGLGLDSLTFDQASATIKWLGDELDAST